MLRNACTNTHQIRNDLNWFLTRKTAVQTTHRNTPKRTFEMELVPVLLSSYRDGTNYQYQSSDFRTLWFERKGCYLLPSPFLQYLALAAYSSFLILDMDSFIICALKWADQHSKEPKSAKHQMPLPKVQTEAVRHQHIYVFLVIGPKAKLSELYSTPYHASQSAPASHHQSVFRLCYSSSPWIVCTKETISLSLDKCLTKLKMAKDNESKQMQHCMTSV